MSITSLDGKIRPPFVFNLTREQSVLSCVSIKLDTQVSHLIVFFQLENNKSCNIGNNFIRAKR